MKCKNCDKKLTGKQTKWCRRCKHHYNEERGKKRRKQLVELHGGKCEKCGYNKYIGALSFHHIEPKDKSFELNTSSVRRKTWEAVYKESLKCQLLCMNCHAEVHHFNDKGVDKNE